MSLADIRSHGLSRYESMRIHSPIIWTERASIRLLALVDAWDAWASRSRRDDPQPGDDRQENQDLLAVLDRDSGMINPLRDLGVTFDSLGGDLVAKCAGTVDLQVLVDMIAVVLREEKLNIPVPLLVAFLDQKLRPGHVWTTGIVITRDETVWLDAHELAAAASEAGKDPGRDRVGVGGPRMTSSHLATRLNWARPISRRLVHLAEIWNMLCMNRPYKFTAAEAEDIKALRSLGCSVNSPVLGYPRRWTETDLGLDIRVDKECHIGSLAMVIYQVMKEFGIEEPVLLTPAHVGDFGDQMVAGDVLNITREGIFQQTISSYVRLTVERLLGELEARYPGDVKAQPSGVASGPGI